ncbi:nicotinate-nucleotide adenylyltransferase [bacterium]|nr:nicotinate-nucleotide adenylyltransferase [bacterium]
MGKSINKVCLFGGTFDPIHNGHIIAAYKILERFDFQKIIFIPNGNPPHRDIPETDAIMRKKMIEFAISPEARFSISNFEINKDSISYFIDTVKYFKEQYSDLHMIIGTDQANRFRTWYKWKEYFPLIKIIVIKKTEPLYEILDFIYMKDIEEIKISSSNIRKILLRGGNIDSLVPASVLKFIREKGLYAG